MSDGAQVWAWTVTLVGAIAAAVIAWRSRLGRFATLPPHHVAATAILATVAWQVAIGLPGTFLTWLTLLQGPRELGPHPVPIAVLQLVYVGAVVVAVAFTLARHRWGSVLGAGLCVVQVLVLAVNVAHLFGLGGGTPFSDDPNLVSLGAYLALQVVPSLVAFWLFTHPYVAGWPQEGASTRP